MLLFYNTLLRIKYHYCYNYYYHDYTVCNDDNDVDYDDVNNDVASDDSTTTNNND